MAAKSRCTQHEGAAHQTRGLTPRGSQDGWRTVGVSRRQPTGRMRGHLMTDALDLRAAKLDTQHPAPGFDIRHAHFRPVTFNLFPATSEDR